MNETPEDHHQKPDSDPMGFFLLVVLAIGFGGAILFAVRWIVEQLQG